MLGAKMISMKRVILSFMLFLSLSIACLAIFYGHIAVFVFAKSNNIDISYGRLTVISLTEFALKELNVVERKRGVGLSSSRGLIELTFDKPPSAGFVLDDVHFIGKTGGEESSYGNIDGLIAVPFSSLWKYKTISGKIISTKNGTELKDFMAVSDEIRFSINGSLTDGDIINADIVIYFGKDLTGKIPPELASMVLKDGENEWKDLAIKLDGNLAKPSIQVTGKLFRLNIGVK